MLKDFQVYQVSKALYKECLKLRLSGAIKNQLERSSLSVCLNLAEGSGKTSKPDRKRFYSIAMGSLRAHYYPLMAMRPRPRAKLFR